MTTNPATIEVPVRYKSALGVVTQAATATQQLVYAIVDKDGTCVYLTTSITDAIKLTQLN
jgi:uncharacterized membrane protein affecting hemolysin expression